MKPILFFFLTLFAAAIPLKGHGETAPHTPAVGTKERTEILDSLRKPVQETLKKPVLFKIDHFKVLNGWALIFGVPLKPDGTAFDYKGTPYEEAKKEDMFEDWFCALLQLKDDTWTVVAWQIGATDAAYVGWDQEYKAPTAIFPPTQ